jgi:hypothetical protein
VEGIKGEGTTVSVWIPLPPGSDNGA